MRWLTRSTAALLVLLVLITVALDRFFWQPASDKPAHVDAVVVIGGAGMRLQEAQRLITAGYASTLIASGPATAPQGCAAVAAKEASLHVAFTCFTPVPFTTQGEARYVANLALQKKWNSFIVVTSTTQATRTRIRFRRCWKGGLRVITVGVPGGQLLSLTRYEVAALVKTEFVTKGC